MFPLPLQIVDGFLIKLNLGDALLVGFVLGLLGVLPLKSRKLLTIHTIMFGFLFLLLPVSLFEIKELSLLTGMIQYKYVGIVLLVVSPLLYTTADR